jgi:hypothetical protein
VKGRLIILAGLLAGALSISLFTVSCDVDDYDPQAVVPGAEAKLIESLGFELDAPQGENRLRFQRSDRMGDRDLAVSTPDDGNFSGVLFPAANRLLIITGSRMDAVAAGFWSAVADSFSVVVQEDILIEEEFPVLKEATPSQGRFAVSDGDQSILVAFVPVSGQNGVSLSLDGGEPVLYTIDAFEDFIGSSAEIWKRKASLGYFILDYLMGQIFFVSDTVNIIETHGGNLVSDGGITFRCDSLVQDPGPDPLRPEFTRTLSWSDLNTSGIPDSGDGFQWLFFACWENDLGDLMGDLADGIIDLSGFTIERDQQEGRQVITGFGFVSDAGQPVGVLYKDFTWVRIEEEFPGSFTFDPFKDFAISGGFNIVFSSPGGQVP